MLWHLRSSSLSLTAANNSLKRTWPQRALKSSEFGRAAQLAEVRRHMSPEEIREKVAKLQTTSAIAEDEAWSVLRSLGVEVVPYLLEAYPKFTKWQGRVSLVFHAIQYARVSEDAFQLGLLAVNDRATLVRYRACGLLAYSLRKEAISHLKPLLSHPDVKTAEDAAAAIDAIKNQNHHYFRDRNHSGRIKWIVNDSDRPA